MAAPDTTAPTVDMNAANLAAAPVPAMAVVPVGGARRLRVRDGCLVEPFGRVDIDGGSVGQRAAIGRDRASVRFGSRQHSRTRRNDAHETHHE